MQVFLIAAAACFPALSAAQAQDPDAPSELDVIAEEMQLYVMPQSGPFHPDQIAVANQAAISNWARSGHSNASSPSFTHWNDAGEIPPVCSVCHAGAGFRSFYGLDGSAPGLPEAPMPIGGVVDCATCHSPELGTIREVKFPSGLMHPVASAGESTCLTCHQGRNSGVQIAAAVGTADKDTPNPELGFMNPHYAVAAATWMGSYGGGGYQYPGKDYSGRFFHARPLATCVSCHEPHSLEVAEQTCLTCHEGGTPEGIRLSRVSFDGSGDLSKGIHADIAANAARLHQMVIDYAGAVAGVPMVYDGHRHPYFFADTNGDGRPDEADGRPAAYQAWTPRLLQAAYNWKFVTADSAAYVHNPHYALELLYDSIEDLSGPLGQDFSAMNLHR
ncbi:MAG: cytochrome C [Paracoccus sp. (in: a-proteobacteria)]|nr:cytochrome C [Paracoccus sp. (in: a-proteobacteria)]